MTQSERLKNTLSKFGTVEVVELSIFRQIRIKNFNSTPLVLREVTNSLVENGFDNSIVSLRIARTTFNLVLEK